MRKSAAAALTARPERQRRFPRPIQIEWTGRRLHRTLQEFTDPHGRPRKFAKNPVVFGQEPGRDLSQSRDQWPILLAAIGWRGPLVTGWRSDALPRCLGRSIGCGAGGRNRERLARARLGLCERDLLRLLIATW